MKLSDQQNPHGAREETGLAKEAPFKSRYWWGLIILTLFFVGALVATHTSVKSYFLLELEDVGKKKLDLNVLALRGKLNQYRTLPAILSRHPASQRAIEAPNDPKAIDTAVDFYLETRNLTGASEIYLLNTNATAIAASNRGEEDSFMGKNFSYRPYYRDAMVGKLGRYFGMGTNSGLRGYYFSSAVRKEGKVVGVVVVKVDVDELEATLREGDFQGFRHQCLGHGSPGRCLYVQPVGMGFPFPGAIK